MSRQLHIISIFHSTLGLTPDSQGKLDVWQFPGPLLQIFGFLICLFQQLYLRGSHHHESVVSRYVFDLINLAQWRIHLSQIWFLLVVGEGFFWKNFSQLYRVFPKLQSLYVPHQKTKMEPPKMDRFDQPFVSSPGGWRSASHLLTLLYAGGFQGSIITVNTAMLACMKVPLMHPGMKYVPVVVFFRGKTTVGPCESDRLLSSLGGLLIVDVFLTHHFMLK